MNNNFYEIPANWYNELNNTFMTNISNTNNLNNNLTNLKNGFLRGNLFNNLYSPYKDYKYGELKPNNKKEELLYSILMYNFALTELTLYLDVNPNDKMMIDLYNNYLNEKNNLCNEYNKQYGPLTLEEIKNYDNKWTWSQNPWPWEVTK